MIGLAKTGENIVKVFFEKLGLKVERIPESKIKTVDFKVYDQKGLFFYLEEKTIEQMPPAWKKIDPVYNTIAKHIYEAVGQFKSVNPEKSIPNVLSFTSMDQARTVNDLFRALTGRVVTNNGKMYPIQSMKKLEGDLSVVDLYLWFNHDRLTGYIMEETDPEFASRMEQILGEVLQ